MNNIILVGNLGKAPIIKDDKGKKLAILNLATHQNYFKDGQWQKNTQWHSVFARGYLAEKVQNCLKGDKIVVLGSLNYSQVHDGDKTLQRAFISAKAIDLFVINKTTDFEQIKKDYEEHKKNEYEFINSYTDFIYGDHEIPF